MTHASRDRFHLIDRVLFVSLAFLLTAFDPAWAAPPETGTTGLGPAQCYRRSASCTTFCGRVTNPDYRYECFAICDRMLNRCLDSGNWTDSVATFAPFTAGPSSPISLDGAIRILVLLADADADGALSLDEMRAVQERGFKQIDGNGDGRASPEEISAFLQSIIAPGLDGLPAEDAKP